MMSDEETLQPEKEPAAEETTAPAAETPSDAPAGKRGRNDRNDRGGDRGGRGRPREREESEWKEKVIQIRRVTKVVKGGKKLSFRAVVVVGNGNGQVGLGIGKSNEVINAIQKGVTDAKKNLITVPMHGKTIPHHVTARASGSKVVLRPASEGTGVIAGGAARAVIELAGIENILSKSLGSNSPLNVARATLHGLAELRTFRQIAELRGKPSVQSILVG
ncbi:MAG: 30S ribosomal protein S5 [Candidatus Melainabacteria bacterium]